MAGLILNPGKTFDIHDFYAVQERENLEIYQRHSRVFGIENAISTAIQNPVTGLLEVMSLYRRDPKAKFSLKERSVKQFIFPLLIETWHQNQIQYLAHRFGSGTGESLAICDHNACIHHAESGFVDLLKSQWPEWSGPEFPEPVKAWLKELESKPLRKKNISFSRADFNDVILVKAYRLGSTALLTKREEQIATIFADGLTYKGIAHELNISPFTVRSHLESIYKKLDVSSKVGLLQALKNNRTKMRF
ncbi:MAG: LuxR C-terminal-related transcriptional regulator [Pseudomonadota bacterium]